MNGAEIAWLLKDFKDFGGVIMPDQRLLCNPAKNKPGQIFILNSRPYPGQHWIALDMRNPQEAEFFDSYGHSMEEYGFRDIATPVTLYNTRQLQQDTSDVCGGYCVMYTVFKLRGFSLHDFLKIFPYNDRAANDAIIIYWLACFDGRTSQLPWRNA